MNFPQSFLDSMTKVCIPEANPPSEIEEEWLGELNDLYGAEIDILEIPAVTLLRFLRAYVNDPDTKEKSFTAVHEYIQWRFTENVDEIAATDFERRPEFIAEWPHGLHGISKDGHIIYIDRPGQFDPKVLASRFSMDEYIQMHIQTMEWMDYCKQRLSERIGYNTYKHIVIMDLDGLGLKHVSGDFTGPLKTLINIDTTKYPETLHKMFVINSPFVFKMIWAMYSPFLDEVTKTRILFSKPKDLLEHIDVNQLPNFLGGLIQYTQDNPPFSRTFRTIRPEHGRRRLSISKTVTHTVTKTKKDGTTTTTSTTTHAEATETIEVSPETTTITTTLLAEETTTNVAGDDITTTTNTNEAVLSTTSPTGSAPELTSPTSTTDPALKDESKNDDSTTTNGNNDNDSTTLAVVEKPVVNTPAISYAPNADGVFENDGRFDDIFSFEAFLTYQRAKLERVRAKRAAYEQKLAEAAAASVSENTGDEANAAAQGDGEQKQTEETSTSVNNKEDVNPE